MVALTSQGRNFKLISLGNATIWDAKAKTKECNRLSLPSRTFQDCNAAEMRWDWNPTHRLNCFARGHSCCCKKEQDKILFSYFQLSAGLVWDCFWSAWYPCLSQEVLYLVSCVLSLLFIIFLALNIVPGTCSVNICLINLLSPQN